MIWNLLEFFKRTEAWGDPDKMDVYLLFLMEKIRSKLPVNCWIKVHKGYATRGHSEKSQHYHGKACDFHVVGCSFLEAEAHIMKYLYNSGMINLVGIGIYPEWLNPGFHLDTRGEKASWSKLNNEYVAYKLGLDYARKNLT